jgi:CHAT domain-containing protein
MMPGNLGTSQWDFSLKLSTLVDRHRASADAQDMLQRLYLRCVRPVMRQIKDKRQAHLIQVQPNRLRSIPAQWELYPVEDGKSTLT